MKRRAILTVFVVMLSLYGCDMPEVIVTNTVHVDGSITRRVEIRNTEDEFSKDFYLVPIDSTWSIAHSTEVSEEGDTTWVMMAEKFFPNAELINSDYAAEDGMNSYMERTASFTKRFRWFNTHFVFTERVERFIEDGHPLSSFLASDEIDFFRLPGSVSDELMGGADSLRYREMSARTDSVIEIWFQQSFIRSMRTNWTRLLSDVGADTAVINRFIEKEGELGEKFSLFSGVDQLISEVFDEELEAEQKHLLDSAGRLLEKRMEHWLELQVYTVQTKMPGKLTGGNGFFTQTGEVAWPVKPELYLFDDYEMIAESQMPNKWAWVVSGIFVLVVLTGFIYRARVRRE